METQERDLFQSYECSYNSTPFGATDIARVSGGVITLNIEKNDTQILSLDTMNILGRFRVLFPADSSAVTNLYLLDPMLMLYMKSFTVNGKQLLFQNQAHDGRLRTFFKYDIGRNSRNTKYADLTK